MKLVATYQGKLYLGDGRLNSVFEKKS